MPQGRQWRFNGLAMWRVVALVDIAIAFDAVRIKINDIDVD
jgi:hypothetical protein